AADETTGHAGVAGGDAAGRERVTDQAAVVADQAAGEEVDRAGRGRANVAGRERARDRALVRAGKAAEDGGAVGPEPAAAGHVAVRKRLLDRSKIASDQAAARAIGADADVAGRARERRAGRAARGLSRLGRAGNGSGVLPDQTASIDEAALVGRVE